MRSNNTQCRKFDAGRPKSNAAKTNRKRFSSNISSDYKILLQLYCVNKKQTSLKKELTYEKFRLVVSGKAPSKRSYPIISAVTWFLTTTFSFNRKVRPQMELTAE